MLYASITTRHSGTICCAAQNSASQVCSTPYTHSHTGFCASRAPGDSLIIIVRVNSSPQKNGPTSRVPSASFRMATGWSECALRSSILLHERTLHHAALPPPPRQVSISVVLFCPVLEAYTPAATCDRSQSERKGLPSCQWRFRSPNPEALPFRPQGHELYQACYNVSGRIPIEFYGNDWNISSILLDSGANANFVSETVANTLQLYRYLLPSHRLRSQ